MSASAQRVLGRVLPANVRAPAGFCPNLRGLTLPEEAAQCQPDPDPLAAARAELHRFRLTRR